jgi:hypothetical protein
MRYLLLCLFLLAIVAGPAAASESPSAAGAGMRLSDYLDDLKAHGLNIVYTSDLVGEDLQLDADPAGASTEERLQSALRPFGLAAVPGPAGSLIIVRARTAPGDTTPPAAAAAPERVPIPELVVTSSQHRLQYQQSESHAYLDRELAARVPAIAEEAVRLTDRLPGTASGGVSTRNHIRGGEANEVLFLLDVLRWAARETGRELVFADPELELAAMRADVSGSLPNVAPIEAATSVLAATRFTYRIEAARIVIER